MTAEFARIGVAFERVAAIDARDRPDLSPDAAARQAPITVAPDRRRDRLSAQPPGLLGDHRGKATTPMAPSSRTTSSFPRRPARLLADAGWIPADADIVKLETFFKKTTIARKAHFRRPRFFAVQAPHDPISAPPATSFQGRPRATSSMQPRTSAFRSITSSSIPVWQRRPARPSISSFRRCARRTSSWATRRSDCQACSTRNGATSGLRAAWPKSARRRISQQNQDRVQADGGADCRFLPVAGRRRSSHSTTAENVSVRPIPSAAKTRYRRRRKGEANLRIWQESP